MLKDAEYVEQSVMVINHSRGLRNLPVQTNYGSDIFFVPNFECHQVNGVLLLLLCDCRRSLGARVSPSLL